MTLDERLTRAARQVAGGIAPPEVDPDVLRARARDHRRRRTSLTAAATLVAVVTVGAVVVPRPGHGWNGPRGPGTLTGRDHHVVAHARGDRPTVSEIDDSGGGGPRPARAAADGRRGTR